MFGQELGNLLGQNYESGGQEFESLRARQLTSLSTIDFEMGP
jgi:hypothetical protein